MVSGSQRNGRLSFFLLQQCLLVHFTMSGQQSDGTLTVLHLQSTVKVLLMFINLSIFLKNLKDRYLQKTQKTRKLPRVPVIPTIRTTTPIVQWAWSGTSTVGKAPGTSGTVIFCGGSKRSQVYQTLLNKLACASLEEEMVKNAKKQQAKKKKKS